MTSGTAPNEEEEVKEAMVWTDVLDGRSRQEVYPCAICKKGWSRDAFTSTQLRKYLWDPTKVPTCNVCRQHEDEVYLESWVQAGWYEASKGHWKNRYTGKEWTAKEKKEAGE